jgi:hypothetical protein
VRLQLSHPHIPTIRCWIAPDGSSAREPIAPELKQESLPSGEAGQTPDLNYFAWPGHFSLLPGLSAIFLGALSVIVTKRDGCASNAYPAWASEALEIADGRNDSCRITAAADMIEPVPSDRHRHADLWRSSCIDDGQSGPTRNDCSW